MVRGGLRLWLTRQRDGNYMVTATKPVMTEVMGTGVKDAYIEPGEPIGVRHLCPLGVRMMWGIELAKCESRRVKFTGELLEPEESED